MHDDDEFPGHIHDAFLDLEGEETVEDVASGDPPAEEEAVEDVASGDPPAGEEVVEEAGAGDEPDADIVAEGAKPQEPTADA